MSPILELIKADEWTTPGPWCYTATKEHFVGEAKYGAEKLFLGLHGDREKNCRFIAAAKNAMEDLKEVAKIIKNMKHAYDCVEGDCSCGLSEIQSLLGE